MAAPTLTDLQDLEKAIASGVLSVQYADRRETYRSLEEMIRIRDWLRTELGLDTNATKPRTRVWVGHRGT